MHHQVVCSRETGRAAANNRNGGRAGRRRLQRISPALCDRTVSKKAFNAVDSDWLVIEAAVAGLLARMVTNTSSNGGHRVCPDQDFPRKTQIAFGGFCEVGLRIFAGGASGSTRCLTMAMDRVGEPPITGSEFNRTSGLSKAPSCQGLHEHLSSGPAKPAAVNSVGALTVQWLTLSAAKSVKLDVMVG